MVTDSSCDFPTPDSIYSFNGGVRLETKEKCTVLLYILYSQVQVYLFFHVGIR